VSGVVAGATVWVVGAAGVVGVVGAGVTTDGGGGFDGGGGLGGGLGGGFGGGFGGGGGGGAALTTAVGGDLKLSAGPAEFFAVTRTIRRAPTSASTTVYVTDVAPATLLHLSGFVASQRAHW
jgi:hypothetical protein